MQEADQGGMMQRNATYTRGARPKDVIVECSL
jgi:hypothetical protein